MVSPFKELSHNSVTIEKEREGTGEDVCSERTRFNPIPLPSFIPIDEETVAVLKDEPQLS